MAKTKKLLQSYSDVRDLFGDFGKKRFAESEFPKLNCNCNIHFHGGLFPARVHYIVEVRIQLKQFMLAALFLLQWRFCLVLCSGSYYDRFGSRLPHGKEIDRIQLYRGLVSQWGKNTYCVEDRCKGAPPSADDEQEHDNKSEEMLMRV